jgi:hypothetical protein
MSCLAAAAVLLLNAPLSDLRHVATSYLPTYPSLKLKLSLERLQEPSFLLIHSTPPVAFLADDSGLCGGRTCKFLLPAHIGKFPSFAWQRTRGKAGRENAELQVPGDASAGSDRVQRSKPTLLCTRFLNLKGRSELNAYKRERSGRFVDPSAVCAATRFGFSRLCGL